jgi:putative membrane protein
MRRVVLAVAVAVSTVSLAAAVVAAAPRVDPGYGTGYAAGPDDATIVAIFDAANSADIETGQLAAERGHSREVRDFGAMLVRDHQHVRQLGRDLAKKLGVTPTPPADDASAKAHAQAMATLRTKRGADFDHAFLQHEAAFHQSVIDAVNATLLPAITNAELKALVVKVAPAFEAHRVAALNLDRQLGGRATPAQRGM